MTNSNALGAVPTTTWVEVSLATLPEQVEAVSDILARYCYGGVAVDEPIAPDPGGDGYTYIEGAPFTVKGYLPGGRGVNLRKRALQRALERAGYEPFRERTVQEQDWANAWKPFFKPVRIGNSIVVRPTWEPFEPLPGDVVIDLDPGMAFGTGTHPTTQLCLALLEQHPPRGQRVIDLGTGSGILSVAALKLGAAALLALDTDPLAVDAARANLRANGLDPAQHPVYHGSIDHAAAQAFAPADLLLGNLTANVLLMLVSGMVRSVRPGGLLILSGIIEGRDSEVAARFEAEGCRLIERRQEGDWLALVLTAPDAR
ncbi:MAG: 50S ribosomal protein L11 methyltransferase [Chloroflexi bacterium]|nr:50S ribosomal protein L11 methyltransferase [Chloroflexota bacterium]